MKYQSTEIELLKITNVSPAPDSTLRVQSLTFWVGFIKINREVSQVNFNTWKFDNHLKQEDY